MSSHGSVVDIGRGLPVVLLHGTLFDHRMFEPQITGLSPSLRVITYDQRGRAGGGGGAFTLDDLVADLGRVLDSCGVDRAVIGGMSLGSFVAMRFALAYPERVLGLVLIGTQATALSPDDQRIWSGRYAAYRGGPVGAALAEKELEVNFSRRAFEMTPELISVWRDRFQREDADALYMEARTWIGMDDIRERLGELTMPVLVVHGSDDAATPLAGAQDVAKLVRDGRILILEEAGHAANLERPDEVNAAILEFAGSCTTGLGEP